MESLKGSRRQQQRQQSLSSSSSSYSKPNLEVQFLIVALRRAARCWLPLVRLAKPSSRLCRPLRWPAKRRGVERTSDIVTAPNWLPGRPERAARASSFEQAQRVRAQQHNNTMTNAQSARCKARPDCRLLGALVEQRAVRTTQMIYDFCQAFSCLSILHSLSLSLSSFLFACKAFCCHASELLASSSASSPTRPAARRAARRQRCITG